MSRTLRCLFPLLDLLLTLLLPDENDDKFCAQPEHVHLRGHVLDIEA